MQPKERLQQALKEELEALDEELISHVVYTQTLERIVLITAAIRDLEIAEAAASSRKVGGVFGPG